MNVIKFGGSSLAECEHLGRAAKIVADHAQAASGPILVVVSAIGDTTDQLIEAAHRAEIGDPLAASALVQKLREAHHAALAACGLNAVRAQLDPLFTELSSVLEGVRLLREQTPRSRALILSFGERLSAPLFSAALQAQGLKSVAVDAREMIVTDDNYAEAFVDREETEKRSKALLEPLFAAGQVAVVTGFLAATPEGVTTTLGRSGSDYTATLLGALLGAQEISIYTDVDGVLTADPRLVREARTLEQVTFREAAEMSYFGARVLHPRTIIPAAEAGISVRVRSSFIPDNAGTLIAETAPTLPHGVKTVTSIGQQALVMLEGRGMAGVPGVARRIFEASELASVNVVMISQASSEQNVSLVVPASSAEQLVSALKERFAPEISRRAIEYIEARDAVAVLSIIGQGMAGTPGIAGKLFSALGGAGVNVLAIAQGSSELSISVAVEEADVERAVRAAHAAFGLTRVINILLLGCGGVGKTFLRLMEQTAESMQGELDLELRLVGLATSRRLLFDATGISADQAPELLEGEDVRERPDDGSLLTQLTDARFTDAALVDVTAADTSSLHLAALSAGVHVVTANKLPVAGPLAQHRALVEASREHGARYQYETTFGAGLPVLHALQELVNTGDRVKRVVGCLSGTLGFITSRLDEGAGLQLAVSEAREHGFTEPDAREDLSGRDVARKALIIARAIGLELEPDDVQLESLVPDLDAGLVEACSAFEVELARRVADAKEAGQVLRYVADIQPARTSVGLQAVDAQSPIGSLRGPDNILVFQTHRYDQFPLVIRGPGAGTEVTAAGVLGDVLKVARRV